MSSLQCADVRNRFTTLNPVPILLVSLECTKLGWFDILRSGSHPAPVLTPVLYICSLYLCTWLYPVSLYLYLGVTPLLHPATLPSCA